MKIINTPKWLMPYGTGLTLYKLVFIRNGLSEDDRAYTIAHENKHCIDWQEIGFFKFPYLYIKELIKNGYMDNIYESSAREHGRLHKDEYKGM